jgi:hypothetical protein
VRSTGGHLPRVGAGVSRLVGGLTTFEDRAPVRERGLEPAVAHVVGQRLEAVVGGPYWSTVTTRGSKHVRLDEEFDE